MELVQEFENRHLVTRTHCTVAMRKLPLILWLGWSYVGAFILWLILRLVFFDRLWALLLINTVADYLFVPLPVLLVASLLMRRWRLLLGLSIPAIAFVVVVAAPLSPIFAVVCGIVALFVGSCPERA